MKSVQLHRGGHGRLCPRRKCRRLIGHDDLDLQPVGVFELEVGLVKARRRTTEFHLVRRQSILPIGKTLLRNGVGDGGDLAAATAADRGVNPGKKRQHGAGRARAVGIVEMVGAGVVEIDRLLHQPQSQEAAVEVIVALRGAAYGRDVMESLDLASAHG
jgi:hypothetical protein